MTSFRFLHAADIHLDSPLHGLSRYDGIPADDVRGATRAAFDNLIERAIAEAVDFVIIAGDLFDGDWRDMGTGLYFARAMGELDRAGIPVFFISGNHDAASVLTRSVPWPENVRHFGHKRPETHCIEDIGVAIHGQSFATAAVTDNLVPGYPAAHAHKFNIGMLHTALSGRENHASYAPCTIDDLRAKGYDYWALGHVHEFEIACADPPIVFPGNLQGRTIRETGPKGAVLVDVEDGAIRAVSPIELDVIRWAHVPVDCTNLDASEVAGPLRAALADAEAHRTSGIPLIVRLVLEGTTPGSGLLRDRGIALRDEARAVASAISPDLWIEKVRVETSEPIALDPAGIGDDVMALIAEAGRSVELAVKLREDLAPFLASAQSTLGDPEDEELRGAANRGDWSHLLDVAATALGARLAQSG